MFIVNRTARPVIRVVSRPRCLDVEVIAHADFFPLILLDVLNGLRVSD